MVSSTSGLTAMSGSIKSIFSFKDCHITSLGEMATPAALLVWYFQSRLEIPIKFPRSWYVSMCSVNSQNDLRPKTVVARRSDGDITEADRRTN